MGLFRYMLYAFSCGVILFSISAATQAETLNSTALTLSVTSPGQVVDHSFLEELNIPTLDDTSDTFTWVSPATEATPVNIWNEDHSCLLGRITKLDMTYDYDPAVNVNFSVIAEENTTFTFSSATISFPAIAHGQAYASAGMTVTDNDGNGATATGLFAGKQYRAIYNGGMIFADLIGAVQAEPDTTLTLSGRSPDLGTTTLMQGVSSISAGFHFDLTAGDSASGTSHFQIVPEPATLSMLAVGAMGLIRRRR